MYACANVTSNVNIYIYMYVCVCMCVRVSTPVSKDFHFSLYDYFDLCAFRPLTTLYFTAAGGRWGFVQSATNEDAARFL